MVKYIQRHLRFMMTDGTCMIHGLSIGKGPPVFAIILVGEWTLYVNTGFSRIGILSMGTRISPIRT